MLLSISSVTYLTYWCFKHVLFPAEHDS
jgi:hypothetical protein